VIIKVITGGFMPENNNSEPTGSITKDSRNRYVVQDIKDSDSKAVNIQLMFKEDSSKSEEKDKWKALDFIKVIFGKGKK
jgi:single-stranded DNA-binding protein